MEKYIEDYNKKREQLIKLIDSTTADLNRAKEDYDKTKNSEIDRKDERLEKASYEVTAYQDYLNILNKRLKLIRLRNDEDMVYRKSQYIEFPRLVEELVPDNLPLRFHGTPFCNVEGILTDGKLSSSVDRLGYQTSYDVSGQISVTTKNSIHITVQEYTELLQFDLPAGCIFVLLPKEENDMNIGCGLSMPSVDFKNEPDRLYAIITTPENLDKVREWGKMSNVDASKVMDFDSFIYQMSHEYPNKKI